MARVFTIAFNWMGKAHSALVSTGREKAGNASFKIRFLSQELMHLIPEGEIIYPSSSSFGNEPKQHLIADLYHSAGKAIDKHLNATNSMEK
jgi:hypothetical protein